MFTFTSSRVYVTFHQLYKATFLSLMHVCGVIMIPEKDSHVGTNVNM